MGGNIDNKFLIDSLSAEQFEIKHVSREEYYELINKMYDTTAGCSVITSKE